MAWPIDFNAEVALVTGGSRNIGLAVAGALQKAGARVCIWGGSDREALDAALAALGGDDSTATGALVRVEDENAVVAGYDEIEAHFGPASILVNGAAVRPYDALATMSLDTWTRTVKTILNKRLDALPLDDDPPRPRTSRRLCRPGPVHARYLTAAHRPRRMTLMNRMPELAPHLKQLRLSGILNTLEARTREAIEHQLPYPDFLALLIHDEVAGREQNTRRRGDSPRSMTWATISGSVPPQARG